MEETEPFKLKKFTAIHETYGPVSGVTCEEWPYHFRYCYFARREDPSIQRSTFTSGEAFDQIQVEK